MLPDGTNLHLTLGDNCTMRRWGRIVILIILIRVICYSCLMLLFRDSRTDEVAKLQESLKQVLSQLATLRQQHSKLVTRIKETPGFNESEEFKKLLDDDLGPTEEYELTRRRIHSNTKELWYFVSQALRKGINETLGPEQLQGILDEVAERKRSLLSDQEKLPALDGYEEWRQSEAASVGDLVQRRLRSLQNPPDCRTAKKLVCRHEDCGFGCQHHHLVYCLIFAYATNRTLILARSNWERKEEGWTYVFHPLSETCTSLYNDNIVPASVASYSAKVVSLSMIHELRNTRLLKLLPYYIPKELAPRIHKFSSNPTSWWVGQMLKYILKPQSHVEVVINDTVTKTSFVTPIVGVHVRCSIKEKHREGKCHDIAEYMSHVDDYYTQLELTRAVDERRVYLATDDADVLKEAGEKYPQYTFYGYYLKAKWKNTRKRHYSLQALTGLLVDLHMLSSCHYVVGALSGNVDRMVYEMMLTNRMDASSSFLSLDHNIYYFYKREHIRSAVIRNKGDIYNVAFNVGDFIDVTYNYNNGTGYGTVLRTNDTGLFPWYKTTEHLVFNPSLENNQTHQHTEMRQTNSIQEVLLSIAT